MELSVPRSNIRMLHNQISRIFYSLDEPVQVFLTSGIQDQGQCVNMEEQLTVRKTILLLLIQTFFLFNSLGEDNKIRKQGYYTKFFN